ncbi:MAG: PIG-L family deacetylase [Kiritimatiellae bacterium]|nr:PIG-L family deacetylase [Kiritimatiellia bacterium]
MKIEVALAALLAAGAAVAEKPAEAKPAKENLVFVCAHPDDTEGFGATAFLLRGKYDLHVVDLTRGELGLGPAGLKDGSTAKRRTAEEQRACAYLGATPHFLSEIDGDACAGAKSVDQLAALLRALKPRAVFTHWPVDAHSDHVQAAAVTAHALARTCGEIRPERYFYEVMTEQTANYRPLYWIDVTSTISNKIEMLSKYECQSWGGQLESDNRKRAEMRGRQAKVGFAETFTTFDGRPIPGGVLAPYAVPGIR